MAKSLYSYSPHSQGAKALAETMGINRIKHENSRFRGGPNKFVINWGCSQLPAFITDGGTRIINDPVRVTVASNKLTFLRTINDADGGHYIPMFTTDGVVAQGWVNAGHSVVARKLLNASGARGLEIVDPGEDVPAAPLYTRYIKKQDEYRVHIVNGAVIDVQRKGLRQELRGQDNINWRVRNLENGFIFVRNDGQPVPDRVTQFALTAMGVLRLDFGAVDVVWNANARTAYVLEVNTAPGLVGTTVESYARALAAF